MRSATTPTRSPARTPRASTRSTRSPKPGDSMLVGLTDAVPACAVRLRLDCEIEGVGVDPRGSPAGLGGVDAGRLGRVRRRLGRHRRPEPRRRHRPARAEHTRGVAIGEPARRLAALPRRRGGRGPARLQRVAADPRCDSRTRSAGRSTRCTPRRSTGELLGLSEGVPAQRFPTERNPIVPGDGPRVLEVGGPDGWQEWSEVVALRRLGPRRRPLRARRGVRRGRARAGRARARRHAAPARRGAAEGARCCACARTAPAAARRATSRAAR